MGGERSEEGNFERARDEGEREERESISISSAVSTGP